MNQQALFDDDGEYQPPYQRHSETSKEAADEIVGSVGTLRYRVWSFLVSCGEHGATDEEMQLALGMNPSTQRPRRVELAKLLEQHGTRLTRSGRKAAVWRAKPVPTINREGGAK